MSKDTESNILPALSAMQDATEACITATQNIADHNLDDNSHPDLRDLITRMLDTDSVWTNDQISDIVNALIQAHTSKSFENAHPGFKEFADTLEARFSEIVRRVDGIQSWIDGNGSDGNVTDLSVAIQAVENKYATMLNSLTTAIEEAKRNGQTETLDRLRAEYNTIYEQKKNEIDEVIRSFYGQLSTGESQLP